MWPVIIRRKDMRFGSAYRIHAEKRQDELELELFHLGICQFLMTYYGCDLIPYNSYWNKDVKIELDISL